MNAGDLTERVQFQRRVATKDSLNQERLTWANHGARVWAQWLPGTSRAIQIASQNQEGIVGGFQVRKNPTTPVSKFWRLLWVSVGAVDRVMTIEGAPTPLATRDGWLVLVSEGTRDNTEGARGG